jgi:DNA polymerase (family X)
MNNQDIAEVFELLAKLGDIHGENSFKTKGYAAAAFAIDKTIKPFAEMDSNEIYNTKNIGVSTGKKIEELLQTGQLSALTTLIEKTPSGVLEMLKIKGIGPKKITTIWKELEIESLGELLYACNENRLLLYKGFGAKNQQAIKEAIEFYFSNSGNLLFATVNHIMPKLEQMLNFVFPNITTKIVGEYALHNDIITKLEIVIAATAETITDCLNKHSDFTITNSSNESITVALKEFSLPIIFYHTSSASLIDKQIQLSSDHQFWDAMPVKDCVAQDENDFFTQNNLPYIPAFLRNTTQVLQPNAINNINKVISVADIKGIIHNHSTWSDGVHTIEEMAKSCIAQGFEYLVISDHSKSAFYAKGLSEERIAQQHIEIEALNKKLAPFYIFKSIECDILNDGSLDYSDNILSTFDLVIASVHSNLKMSEEKAMQRLINAIENPYTTILGHATGRLLLSRPGYPIDHKKIIDACAANNVVIELNANPVRLDIDWKWIDYAIQNDVMISINPDAHSVEGFSDIQYGVIAAQKAMVQPIHNLSSYSLSEFEAFLFETRNSKEI